MQDPNTIIMIHHTMIQEEMRRNDPEHHLTSTERAPGSGALAGLRAATARMLIALGERVSSNARDLKVGRSRVSH